MDYKYICPKHKECSKTLYCSHVQEHNRISQCGSFLNCPECIRVDLLNKMDDIFNDEDWEI